MKSESHISYTWEDWESLKAYLKLDLSSRFGMDSGITTADNMLKHWVGVISASYGEDICNSILDILFKVPLENLPLYINVRFSEEGAAINIGKIALWRLSICK